MINYLSIRVESITIVCHGDNNSTRVVETELKRVSQLVVGFVESSVSPPPCAYVLIWKELRIRHPDTGKARVRTFSRAWRNVSWLGSTREIDDWIVTVPDLILTHCQEYLSRSWAAARKSASKLQKEKDALSSYKFFGMKNFGRSDN